MAVREVLRMGDRRLLERSSPVERFDTPELHALLQDMHDTMDAMSGAGLAAPQIAVPLRVVVFGLKRNPRDPEAEEVPYTILINPIITPVGDVVEEGWEGCLSVPGMRGLVPRWRALRYQGRDQLGGTIDRTVSGFHARVVQHECDHLQGVLYPMRVKDFTRFGFTEILFPELPANHDD